MIQVFLWKANAEDISLVDNLIRAAFNPDAPVGEDVCLIQDLSHEQVKIEPNATLLAFGGRCFNIISSSTDQKVHQLTTPSKLKNKPANKKTRVETYELLKKISENQIVVQEITLTDKDLEKLLLSQLKGLQDTLIQKGQEVWRGTTATGKTIALTLKPNTTVSDCEIVVTFEEVFAAKYAIEALGVDSLTVTGS